MRTPEVLFIGINGVVGGGIFLLPGQVAEAAGPAAVWAYLVAGVLVILIGLSYAEISTMYDRTVVRWSTCRRLWARRRASRSAGWCG